MTVRETIVRNTIWYGLVTVIGLSMGLVMSVVLARGLGPTLMGDYSYILWASRTLFAIATLGFPLATVRYSASALAQGDRELAGGIVGLMRHRQIATTAIVVALAIPVVVTWAPSPLMWPLIVACLDVFGGTLESVYSSSIYGAQRYDLTAQVSTIKMMLWLVAAIVVLSMGGGILGLMIGGALGSVVAAWLQRRSFRQLYPGTAAPVPSALRRELNAYLIPLSVVVVLDAVVWDRSEIFFLRLWGSSHDIAFYSLAFGLATKAMIFPEITVGALLPAFSALHGSAESEEFRRVYRSAIRYVALAGVPIAAIGIAVAHPLIALLYGSDYLPVASLFSAMIGVAVFAAVRRVAWSALRGSGDRRCAVTATSVAAAINIGAAVLLVGPYGSWGAVIANSAAQLVATVWALVVMARTHRCGFPVLDVAKILAAGVLALGVSLAVGFDDPGLARMIWSAIAGLATFVAVCGATRVVGSSEWAVLVASTRRLAARPA